MPKPAPGEAPVYIGTWDCAKKTIRREGFLGLYKGMNVVMSVYKMSVYYSYPCSNQ